MLTRTERAARSVGQPDARPMPEVESTGGLKIVRALIRHSFFRAGGVQLKIFFLEKSSKFAGIHVQNIFIRQHRA